MIIDRNILDDLATGKGSPCLRMSMDLWTSAEDCSRGMLNALELGISLTFANGT